MLSAGPLLRDPGVGPSAALRWSNPKIGGNGRREITAALYQTSKDKKRGYLRSAHVRAIGPSNTDFGIYRKMRGDSESLNRVIEDSLYRNHRAHSDGAASREVDVLGLAGLINALTRERMRLARLARPPDPPAADPGRISTSGNASRERVRAVQATSDV